MICETCEGVRWVYRCNKCKRTFACPIHTGKDSQWDGYCVYSNCGSSDLNTEECSCVVQYDPADYI